MARYDRSDIAPGVYVENGLYYYNGNVLPTALVGNSDAVKKYIAGQDENAARQQTQQQGEDLAKQQSKLAEEFKSNVPKYTGLLQDQSKKTLQRGLAENIANLKQNSSTRGFLGGTGTQKQQAEAQAQTASDIMSKDADISDAVQSQAKQFENQALATKMSLQGSANQAQIDALRQSILDTQRQSELWKALGGVAGAGIGSYYGNKLKTS